MRTFVRDIPEQKIYKNGKKRILAEYICECGKLDIIAKESNKLNTSCSACGISKSKLTRTKVFSEHPLYRKWSDMKNRCNNSKVDRYNVYGGRGIKVCEEWKNSYLAFYTFCMSKNWNNKLSLDRIDVNKDYSSENCRLIPIRDQYYNLQNTIYVEYENKEYPLAQICNELGLKKERYTIISGIKKHNKSFVYYIEKNNIEHK